MNNTLRCFCLKCKTAFDCKISSKIRLLACPKCGHLHDLYELPNITNQITKEIKSLLKKFVNFYFYTRVEFEQDYKLYDNTDEYLQDTIELFTENGGFSGINPPRFEVVAYQFKASDGYRFFLHDDSLKPELYDIASAYNIKATFDEAISKPHLYVFPEDAKLTQITLFDFSRLAYLSKLYVSYYQHLSLKREIVFFPLLIEE